MKKTHFERALFLSWYCSRGDCTFCYMSTQKERIKEPKKARRSYASILAEAIICKECGWEIEFLSGGYESYSADELRFILGKVVGITGQKQWLNMGVISKDDLSSFKPYLAGVCGAVECINEDIRNKVCPSKPLSEIKSFFSDCDELGIKKAMTIIIGLGETLDDVSLLKKFIKDNEIVRITFYALNPHEGTLFKEGPKTDYYVKWLREIRKEFPELTIIAGSWVDRIDEIPSLLSAGADYFTKFPSIKLFGKKHSRKIENTLEENNIGFSGTLTKVPKINLSDYEDIIADKELFLQVKNKLGSYLSKMSGGKQSPALPK